MSSVVNLIAFWAAFVSLPTAATGGEAKSAVPSFRAAYRRERAQLRAEKKALQATLEKLQNRQIAEKVELEETIRGLVRTVAEARKEADRYEEKARALNRRLENLADHGHLVDATLDLAAATLKKKGLAAPQAGNRAARLRAAFTHALYALRLASSVYTEQGAFFDTGGREVAGRVVRVGAVAALGLGTDIGGVLAKGPGGTLQLIDGSAAARQAAADLAAGKQPARVPLYLFSSGEGPSKVLAEETLWSMLQAGGVIAWIILALAGLALLVVIERVFTLAVASRRSQKVFARAKKAVAGGRFEDVVRGPGGGGALARVLNVVLAQRDASRERLDELAAEAILKEGPRLERFFSLLGVVAAVAPLLGLLGTVSGMISTFRVITEYGTGDPKLLSGGISEALITTELGLAVAIPVLLVNTVLSRWRERLNDDMQTYALSLINVLKKQTELSAEAQSGESLETKAAARQAAAAPDEDSAAGHARNEGVSGTPPTEQEAV
jgi:biopolymer transport protein ExbB